MQQGLVCILDALGTKGIWSREESGRYIGAVRNIHKHLADLKVNSDILVPSGTVLEYISISDTIIITMAIDPKVSSINPVLLIPPFAQIIMGVFGICLEHNIFMRGAISFGKFIKDANVVIGPAVDDAASFHEKPDMIGVILTPSATLLAEGALEMLKLTNRTQSNPSIIKYRTPFKDGKYLDLFQVNWPPIRRESAIRHTRIHHLADLKLLFGGNPIPEEAYSKYENTIRFYEFCTASLDSYI